MVRTITYLQSYPVHYFVHSGSQKCTSQTDPKRFKPLCTARLLLNVAKTYCMVLKNAKSSRLTLWCFFFFFFFVICFIYFYYTLHCLQNIGYNICITLITIHTYTYNNFFFFYTFTLHLTTLQYTYNFFEKIIIYVSRSHTRTRHTHTHGTSPYTTDPS